jgi:hypothetical protein
VLLDKLLKCQLFTNQLSSEGWAEAFRILDAGSAHSDRIGYEAESAMLQLPAVQQLSTDVAYQVMHARAKLGHSFTPVFAKVPSARSISTAQVATLLQLGLENGHCADVANMSYCPAAQQLDADLVLATLKRLVQEWLQPATFGRYQAVEGLLGLDMTEHLAAGPCQELADMAIKAGAHAQLKVGRILWVF